MAKVTQQQIHALISLYLKNYKSKYGRDPLNFNRYRDKWGFQGMIEDLGVERAKEVIDWYFSARSAGHSTNYLLNNYDKINTRMREREEDEIDRQKLLEESRKRVEEWRAARGE
jgi:hypothetical protein